MLILQHSRLRWSSPLLFNDVAEFRRMPRFDPSVADAHKLLPTVIADAVFDGATLDEASLSPPMKLLLSMLKGVVANGLNREGVLDVLAGEAPQADDVIATRLQKHFESLDLGKARVLCMTTEYDNDAMWGNYAEAHAGCVLGFGHITELSTPLLAATPVAYCEERPVVGSGLDFLLYGDTAELRERTLHAVCYTKKLAWAYEREWRVLTWRPNEQDRRYGDYLFYPAELESVTLGVRASNATAEKVRDVLSAKYPCAKLYRMVDNHGELVRFPIPSANGDA